MNWTVWALVPGIGQNKVIHNDCRMVIIHLILDLLFLALFFPKQHTIYVMSLCLRGNRKHQGSTQQQRNQEYFPCMVVCTGLHFFTSEYRRQSRK